MCHDGGWCYAGHSEGGCFISIDSESRRGMTKLGRLEVLILLGVHICPLISSFGNHYFLF